MAYVVNTPCGFLDRGKKFVVPGNDQNIGVTRHVFRRKFEIEALRQAKPPGAVADDADAAIVRFHDDVLFGGFVNVR